jgi:hypothetical protein
MMLDGIMFHFTRAATIGQLLGVVGDKGTKGIKERKKGGKE